MDASTVSFIGIGVNGILVIFMFILGLLVKTIQKSQDEFHSDTKGTLREITNDVKDIRSKMITQDQCRDFRNSGGHQVIDVRNVGKQNRN